MYLHELKLSRPTFTFLRRNRHMQPEEILSLLQGPGRFHTTSFWQLEEILYLLPVQPGPVHFHTTSFWQRWRLASAPLYAELFESYISFCNAMAAAQDSRIVVVDGARTSGPDISASHWPSNVAMATCHPVSSISDHDDAMDAVEDSGLGAQFQDCRVQPGDVVLQLYSMQEKAVVRQEGNKLVFVDALEAMGSPTVVFGWTKAYDISEMPLVDIDRYTQTPPTLPPPQPRRQDTSSHFAHWFPFFKLHVSLLTI